MAKKQSLRDKYKQTDTDLLRGQLTQMKQFYTAEINKINAQIEEIDLHTANKEK